MRSLVCVLLIAAGPCRAASSWSSDVWQSLATQFGRPGNFNVKIERLNCTNTVLGIRSVETWLVELDNAWNDKTYCGDCKDGCECSFDPPFLNDFGRSTVDYVVYMEIKGCGISGRGEFWMDILKNGQETRLPYGRRAIAMVPSRRDEDVKLTIHRYTFDDDIGNESGEFSGSPVWWHGEYEDDAMFQVQDFRNGVVVTEHYDDDYVSS